MNYDTAGQSSEELFEIVNSADGKDWIMAAGCQNEHASLVTGHAYSILGAYNLIGGPTVLQLRNPWGSEMYSGPYSDSDSSWTAAQKE